MLKTMSIGRRKVMSLVFIKSVNQLRHIWLKTSEIILKAQNANSKFAVFAVATLVFILAVRQLSGSISPQELKSIAQSAVLDSHYFDIERLIDQIPSEIGDDPMFRALAEQPVVSSGDAILPLQGGGVFRLTLEDTYANYVSYLRVCLENNSIAPILPFSWIDWYDFSLLDDGLDDMDDKVPLISSFETLESQIIKAKRGLKYIKSLNYKIEKMIFMDSEAPFNYIIKASNNLSGRSSIRDPDTGILFFLQSQEIYSTPVNYQSDLKLISQLYQNLERILGLQKSETRSNLDYDSFDGDDMFINLHEFDFEFNVTQRVEELENFVLEGDIKEEVRTYYQNIYAVKQQLGSGSEKFFHEVLLEDDPSLAGSHYDWRFFKKVLDGKMKYFALHHLIRTWQEFANKERIIYWLSHGNLLSWKWSGASFIWDHDCDIQLPIKHLEYLAINFNGSLIIEDPKYGLNRYLIEVSPFFSDRSNFNGKNSIDGRIIDITTGLYIDLTGLSTTHEILEDGTAVKYLSDKHIHKYLFQSLSPLRSTLYEGKQSWVPHDVDYILIQEYPTGLMVTEYNDYRYLPNFNAWFRNPDACLEQSSFSERAFHIPAVDSREYCDDLSSIQVSHIMNIWNIKRIENEFQCFNKINCKLPLSDRSLQLIGASTTADNLSNPELWNLSSFAADGIRKIVHGFDFKPIPETDMTKLL